jgi:predicted naringenin-chalcone synthase
MTWDVTDSGFRMRLSAQVPDVIRENVGGLVEDLLAKNGVDRADVDGWAIHPGGSRILRHVAKELKITDEEIAPSFDILREYGNCSSPTVLMVLQHMLRTRPIRPGKAVVLLGFGPGLTLFAALLKA